MPSVTNDGIYYVDLSDDPDFQPGSFKSVYPENCTFDDEIRNIGNVAFQLSYSAEDQDGNQAVPPPSGGSQVPFIGPYRSYYRLRYGNAVIHTGIITNTNSHYGDDYVSIAGKTWPHIWERWTYPWNPNSKEGLLEFLVGTPTGDYVIEFLQQDVISIFHDLLYQFQMQVQNRLTFDISALTGSSGIIHNMGISGGNMTYFNSYVNTLSSIGVGFDWWVTTDRKVYWASPYRYGSPVNVSVLDIYNDARVPPFLDLSFSNDGPAATHLTGRGAGWTTATDLAAAYGSPANQQRFTRMDAYEDFGDLRNRAIVNEKTAYRLMEMVQPQHDIPISLDPAEIPNYWTNYKCGKAIWINVDMGYHIIDSPQRLKSYSATVDLQGNAKVDWKLEQIYDDLGDPMKAPSAMIPEG